MARAALSLVALLSSLGPSSLGLAIPVTFEVEVPRCTPKGETVFLRSNRTTVDVFEHDPLTQVGPARWRGTFEVTTDLASFNYKYSHTLCDATACPGIEKDLSFTGTGAEIPDRTLPAGVTSVLDQVWVWRSALVDFDAQGQPLGTRAAEAQVAFCDPYVSVTGEAALTIGYDAFGGGPVTLEYGPTAAYGSQMVGNAHRNHFELSGLQPGQVYHYRVTEGGVSSPDYEVRAPPAGPPFRFAHLGDVQFVEAQNLADNRTFAQLLEAFDPHLTVSSGDMVHSTQGAGPGTNGWQHPEIGRWSVFFGVMADSMARAPFMAAMGNHEEDAPFFWSIFEFPVTDPPAIDHYDFRFGNVHFFVLYTGTTAGYDLDGILGVQTPWLQARLSQVSAKWKVVLLHRGPNSQGANHPTDGQAFYENSAAGRPAWREVFATGGVDLVLAGHNHNFTYAREGSVRFITSCAGAPTHALASAARPTTIHAEPNCALSQFYVEQDTLRFEAVRVDGSLINEASFALCEAAQDCESQNSGCPASTTWRCVQGACQAECTAPMDAGTGADLGEDMGAPSPDASLPDAGAPADLGMEMGMDMDIGPIGPIRDGGPRVDQGFFGQKPKKKGCTCASRPGPSGWWALLLPLMLRRKRGLAVAILALLGCSSASASKPANQAKAMLEAHNEVRARYKVEALAWSPKLATNAQSWADELARSGCTPRHRSNTPYGENLFWASAVVGSDGSRKPQRITARAVVQDWASEAKDYDLERGTCRKVCGHFTQVIWRKTQRVGCGVAMCPDQAQVWVCSYDPPGNFRGQRPL